MENLSKAKCFDHGQPARTAQADQNRYFSHDGSQLVLFNQFTYMHVSQSIFRREAENEDQAGHTLKLYRIAPVEDCEKCFQGKK